MLSAAEHTSIDGEHLIFRSLSDADADVLGAFLEGLSPETARRFRPHPLSREAAGDVCRQAGTGNAVRLIAANPDGNRIVAYFVVEFTIPENERERYRQYGFLLSDERDCRIAPAVADAYQNVGLGSQMMRWTLDLIGRLGRSRVVLFGGTQASNARAIHFYEKFGFMRAGTFEEKGLDNIDMALTLR